MLKLLTFTCFAIGLKSEAHRAAASDPCGCILTRPVAATVVDGAGLCTQQDRDMQRRAEASINTCFTLPEADRNNEDDVG